MNDRILRLVALYFTIEKDLNYKFKTEPINYRRAFADDIWKGCFVLNKLIEKYAQ